MNITQIEETLHQRRPYLMVDEVIEINKDRIKTLKVHHGDEAHIHGHFPGAPVVPGAMLQEICTQSAGILISKFYSPVKDYNSQTTKGWALGVLKKVNYAKFQEITKPDKEILAVVDLIDFEQQLFKFSAKIFQDNQLKAKFSFNLVNISDEYIK